MVVKLVQGLGSKSYRYPQKDLQILARYANGLEVKPKQEKITDGLDPMNLMSYPLTMSAFEGYQWLKTNKGNYKNAFNEVARDAKSANNVLKKSGINGVLNIQKLYQKMHKTYMRKLKHTQKALWVL